jgi:uncharacterized membrane protein YkvA (DUF1232 family)
MKFRNLFVQGALRPRSFLQFLFHLPKFVKLYYRLFKDPRVPVYLKLIVVGALIYVLSPIDLIPDLLVPLIGRIDDIIVLIAALRYFLIKCPQGVLWEHVRAIEAGG